MSIKTTVAAKLKTILTDMGSFNLVTFDKIRLLADDFRQHELPAAQIFDIGAIHTPRRQYTEVDWELAIEIVMKSDTGGEISQSDLWDLEHAVKLAIGAKVSLPDVSGFVHFLYDRTVTDLHLLEPYYTCRIHVIAKFNEDYTGC